MIPIQSKCSCQSDRGSAKASERGTRRRKTPKSTLQKKYWRKAIRRISEGQRSVSKQGQSWGFYFEKWKPALPRLLLTLAHLFKTFLFSVIGKSGQRRPEEQPARPEEHADGRQPLRFPAACFRGDRASQAHAEKRSKENGTVGKVGGSL